MKVSKELLQGLNGLLTRNRDAQKGYVEAANHINQKELSKWMIDYSTQRQLFATELDLEIRRLGGEPDDSTSILGEIHRVWIDLKGQFSSNDPHAMLEECIKVEKKVIASYNKILEEHNDIPIETRDLLNRHKSRIINALTEINIMMKMYVPAEG